MKCFILTFFLAVFFLYSSSEPVRLANLNNNSLTFYKDQYAIYNRVRNVSQLQCISGDICIENSYKHPNKLTCNDVGEKHTIHIQEDVLHICRSILECSNIYCVYDDNGNIITDTCYLEYRITYESLVKGNVLLFMCVLLLVLLFICVVAI